MIEAAKSVLKTFAGMLVREYRINWIYACREQARMEDQTDLAAVDDRICHLLELSPTLQMQKAAAYTRRGLNGLAILENSHPVCVAHFAEPEQYDRAGTWPLRRGEAALMDIATEESEHGKGHAVRLIRLATSRYHKGGYSRLIAFIWWSNQPSVRAFAKAGWHRIGLSIELQRRSGWRSLRIPM